MSKGKEEPEYVLTPVSMQLGSSKIQEEAQFLQKQLTAAEWRLAGNDPILL